MQSNEEQRRILVYISILVVNFLCWAFILLFVLTAMSHAQTTCSRDLDELTPQTKEVYRVLEKRCTEAGIEIRPICTYRSQEVQDKLYAQGRTAPGKIVTWTRRSRHTERIAFDVAVFTSSGISWNPEDYKAVGALSRGLGVVWGGDWKVRDYGHFELDTDNN